MDSCVRCGHSRDDHTEVSFVVEGAAACTACPCGSFLGFEEALKLLSVEDRRLLAAATAAGIDPNGASVDVELNRGGHVEGISVKIQIHTGRGLGTWVEAHLPSEVTPRVAAYLVKKLKHAASLGGA